MNYVVEFYFTSPIYTYWDAQEFLDRFDPILPASIKTFKIEVADENGGKIYFTSDGELSEKDKEDIKGTLKDEFFEGFGRIFERQAFANRFSVGFSEGSCFADEDFEVSCVRSKNDFELVPMVT